jgi:hypothetical protein
MLPKSSLWARLTDFGEEAHPRYRLAHTFSDGRGHPRPEEFDDPEQARRSAEATARFLDCRLITIVAGGGRSDD